MTPNRIPRPIGTTELSNLYNRTNDNQYYEDLYQKTIHHYIRNNFSYCGIYYNIEQFSKLIGVKETDIMRHLNSYGQELSKLNREMVGGDLIRAITSISMSWALEDRSAIQQQVAILQSSQGAEYKPFVSGELTKAIKVAMDSNASMQSLLRTIMPSQGATFLPLEEEGKPNEKGITVDQAVMLMKSEKVTPLLQDPDKRESLKAQYNIEAMPEVNALRQVNMDTSKEGLGILDITKVKEGQIIGHENRREEEYGIDPDSDEI